MLRFSIFGFPVAVHWLFWVTMALFGGGLNASTPEQYQSLVIWIVAAFLSVLIHELGHTFFMRHYGANASILLYAFGGLAVPDRGFKRGQHIIVSLAGPLVEIAAGFLTFIWLKERLDAHTFRDVFQRYYAGANILDTFLYKFSFVSIFWGVFNLIPIYPMDGGQVLDKALGPRLSKITFGVGILCAVLVSLWMLSSGSIIGTIFFGMMAFENIQRLRGAPTNSILRPN